MGGLDRQHQLSVRASIDLDRDDIVTFTLVAKHESLPA